MEGSGSNGVEGTKDECSRKAETLQGKERSAREPEGTQGERKDCKQKRLDEPKSFLDVRLALNHHSTFENPSIVRQHCLLLVRHCSMDEDLFRGILTLLCWVQQLKVTAFF